jgi:hypothetical protein
MKTEDWSARYAVQKGGHARRITLSPGRRGGPMRSSQHKHTLQGMVLMIHAEYHQAR